MCAGNPDGAIGVFGGVPGRLVAKKSRPIVAIRTTQGMLNITLCMLLGFILTCIELPFVLNHYNKYFL